MSTPPPSASSRSRTEAANSGTAVVVTLATLLGVPRRRFEVVPLSFEELGEPQRRSVFEVRTDGLESERQSVAEFRPAGNAVAGCPVKIAHIGYTMLRT